MFCSVSITSKFDSNEQQGFTLNPGINHYHFEWIPICEYLHFHLDSIISRQLFINIQSRAMSMRRLFTLFCTVRNRCDCQKVKMLESTDMDNNNKRIGSPENVQLNSEVYKLQFNYPTMFINDWIYINTIMDRNTIYSSKIRNNSLYLEPWIKLICEDQSLWKNLAKFKRWAKGYQLASLRYWSSQFPDVSKKGFGSTIGLVFWIVAHYCHQESYCRQISSEMRLFEKIIHKTFRVIIICPWSITINQWRLRSAQCTNEKRVL